MRAYELGDVLDFGKHKGKTIREVYCGSPRLAVQHAPGLIRKLVRAVINTEGTEYLLDLRREFGHQWLDLDVFTFVHDLNQSWVKLEIEVESGKSLYAGSEGFPGGVVRVSVWDSQRPSEQLTHKAGVVISSVLKTDYEIDCIYEEGTVSRKGGPNFWKTERQVFEQFDNMVKPSPAYLLWCLENIGEFRLTPGCTSILPYLPCIGFRSFTSSWGEGLDTWEHEGKIVAAINWEPLFSGGLLSSFGEKIKQANASKIEALQTAQSYEEPAFDGDQEDSYSGPNGRQRYLNDAFDGEAAGYWNVE